MNFDLLIEKAKKANINEIEIYSQHTEGLEIAIFNHKVDKYVMNNTTGLAVRGMYEGNMGYVSIENLSDDNIDFIIEKIKDNANILTSHEKSFIFEGSDSYPEIKPVKADFLKINPQDKIELLKNLETKIKEKDPRITTVSHCAYHESKVDTTIQNSKGLNLVKSEAYCIVVAQAVAKENNDVKSHFDFVIANDFNNLNIDELAERIVSRAVSMLNATSTDSKRYPIIFENKVFANILNAFQSMFSGESVLKKLTSLQDKLGQKIVSDKITIVDDPLSTEAYSQDAFDDEGVRCYTKEVVSKGVLKTFLHNLQTAKALNSESTGNGFKRGLNAPVGVKSSNFILQPGDISLDEMIQTVDEGIYITNVAGLHAGVNPVSGDFSLQSSGFLIKDKKIVRPITLIVVAGNFLDMLNHVELIGNDLIFTMSSIGSPSVKIESLQVSGK